MDYISDGHSVLVAAPTGAGKTLIAEHVIQNCIKRREKVIYTAPIKALSNQKYRDFNQDAQHHVGIQTGDVTLNAEADVLIMTTEIFRNKILEDPDSLKNYSWIIFDEIHYLDDYERGCVWEESLIFMPEHMRVLGLSATVPNIDEIGDWLTEIHGREVKIVKEYNRPVPLQFYFQCGGQIFDDVDKMGKYGYRQKAFRLSKSQRLPRYVTVKPNRITDLVKQLADDDMMPCIYFVFSRRKTESLAQEMIVFDFLDEGERKEILELFDRLCKKYDIMAEASAGELRPLVARGVAYHHAGMLPTLKEVVEQLFTSRLLKIIFTTETFALGINMPARSVIFDELRKFYGNGFKALKTRDFFQMAGRAGRRSIDTEGHVFCRVNPHFISPEEVRRVIYSRSEKVRSQFNASYATVLNLYQQYKEKLYDIYPYSLHYYQTKKGGRKRALAQLEGKVNILKELGYIKDEELTLKGRFASKVYGYEIILSELFEMGILDKLTVRQLGILMIAVIYEVRKGVFKPPYTKEVKGMEADTKHIIRRIHELEKVVGLRDLTKRCYFHLSPAMDVWVKGRSFREMMEMTNVDEGEVVRYLRMCIQLSKEVASGPVSPELKDNINKLVHLINRDVVDTEKQLRS